jgi:AcrR family transcriptional regulator
MAKPPPKTEHPLAPRRAPSQARARATVDAILEATARLLITCGFEGVNTNVVAREAGVKPPAIYRYFPNKFALYAALAQKLQDELDLVMDAAVVHSDDRPLAEVVDRLIDVGWAFWRRRPAFVVLWHGEWSVQGSPSPAAFFGERTVRRLAGATARFRALGPARETLVLAAAMQMSMAMLTVALLAAPTDQDFMVGEAKRALLAYLKPLQGEFR